MDQFDDVYHNKGIKLLTLKKIKRRCLCFWRIKIGVYSILYPI